MACTHTASWAVIGQEWDIPRLLAWQRTIGNLPPLQHMIGAYLKYKLPEREKTPLSKEDHAERLIMGLIGGMAGG